MQTWPGPSSALTRRWVTLESFPSTRHPPSSTYCASPSSTAYWTTTVAQTRPSRTTSAKPSFSP